MFVRLAPSFAAALLALALSASPAGAAGPVGDKAAHPAEIAVRDFVTAQARAHGAQVEVRVDRLPPSVRANPCSAYAPSIPAGTRLWGRSVVALNCAAPQPWVVYVPVNISVHGRYLATARAVSGGHVLGMSDLKVVEGDLTALPDGTFNEPREAVGLRTRVGLAEGLPLGRQHVVVPPVVRQGDPVKVIARGPGFSASSEGKALANAQAGETVRVRMPSGQTVTGIARAGGIVEINQ